MWFIHVNMIRSFSHVIIVNDSFIFKCDSYKLFIYFHVNFLLHDYFFCFLSFFIYSTNDPFIVTFDSFSPNSLFHVILLPDSFILTSDSYTIHLFSHDSFAFT